MVKIKLPHSNWKVMGWNPHEVGWFNIEAEAICENFMLESKESIVNCETYIRI
jgi:hypothetical protein